MIDMLCVEYRPQALPLEFFDLEIIHQNLSDVIVAGEGCRSVKRRQSSRGVQWFK
jgi:hypothetical protein